MKKDKEYADMVAQEFLNRVRYALKNNATKMVIVVSTIGQELDKRE